MVGTTNAFMPNEKLPKKSRNRSMSTTKTRTWHPQNVLDLAKNYQGAAVLAAAADLELFDAVAGGSCDASTLAVALKCDERGIAALLDALAALGLLEKSGGQFALSPGAQDTLTAGGAHSVLAMAQHQANCMRRWARLAESVKSGHPASSAPSIRGEDRDYESFITAMDDVSAPVADEVIGSIQPLESRHLLDIGGASGTWTGAFLRACAPGKATLFDLPEVIPLARERLGNLGLTERVAFVPGDFYGNELPCGADLGWVSAIIHQNSRQQNRELFAKVFRALDPKGRIAIRDYLMEPDRVRPVGGALFAVNMLVATPKGGTFTFAEITEDLESAGFVEAVIARQDELMNSIVIARKP